MGCMCICLQDQGFIFSVESLYGGNKCLYIIRSAETVHLCVHCSVLFDFKCLVKMFKLEKNHVVKTNALSTVFVDL